MGIRKIRRQKNIWLHELDDVIRGASGGFLFGIPLLYTMEVWWIGSSAKPLLRLTAIAATFIAVFLLIRTEGFRKVKHNHFLLTVMDSIEALAIGLICSALVLILLREITLETSLSESLGKVIFEGVPFALGVALARSLLSGDRYRNSDQQNGEAIAPKPRKNGKLHDTLSDIGATLIGTMIVAFNIAPTDEVPMIASAISPPWLLAIMAASLIISYAIVFQSGFTNQAKRIKQRGIFQRPLSETVAAYLVSLMASALMLLFFHQLSFTDPWSMWLSYTLVLGFPGTIGGAAGRLA